MYDLVTMEEWYQQYGHDILLERIFSVSICFVSKTRHSQGCIIEMEPEIIG